jgi:hypothetical protein
MVPVAVRKRLRLLPPFHALIVNQIAATMIATTIAAQITGVTFFELPLRGESLAG